MKQRLPATLLLAMLLFWRAVYPSSPQNHFSLYRGSESNELGSNSASHLAKTEHVAQSPGVSILQDEISLMDYQSNGGDERHLWVLPDGTVHAIYFGQTSDWRGTFYAYSADNGNSFSKPVRVETYVADFPSMDITSDGRAVIASHVLFENWSHDWDGIIINIASGPGSGSFDQMEAPADPTQIIWPRIAVPSDTQLVFWGSPYWEQWEDRSENCWNSYNTGAKKFTYLENQILFPGVKGELRGSIAKSSGGKVATVLYHYAYFTDWYGSWLPIENDFAEGNIIMRESNDGGITFDPPVNITNYVIDTVKVNTAFGSCISALYHNENLHIVWEQVALQPELYCRQEDLRIVHWSKNVNDGIPTEAVRWSSDLFGTEVNFVGSQRGGIKTGWNHLAICNPTIGVDESGILTIAFTGFSGDSTHADPVTGYSYGDIWAVSSADNGLTWSAPVNLTNSPNMDDRYPYISTWNEAGKINVLYQTDTRAGSYFDSDDSDEQLGEKAQGDIDHLFLKVNHPPITTVEEKQTIHFSCHLKQNTPNPFNPSTTIEFDLSKNEPVTLEVLNLRGQIVAILASDVLGEGSHTYIWHAEDSPSGVYFYRLTTADFIQTRKMLLVR